MALASDATWGGYVIQDVSRASTKSMVVKNAAVVYKGSLCSHDTDQGEIKPFDGTQTDRLAGWVWGSGKTGNNAAPRTRAIIKPGGFIVRNLPVTNLANSAADYGAEVYATDDGTYTLNDPGSGVVVGRVIPDEDRASGVAVVYMRNFLETIT